MRDRSGWTKEQKRRERNRERMAKVRKLAKKKHRCRVCSAPVVMSERTGRPSALCGKHLAEDRARKTPPKLPWEEDAVEFFIPWEDEILEITLGGRAVARMPTSTMIREVGRPIDIRIDHRGRVALLDGQYRYILPWRK